MKKRQTPMWKVDLYKKQEKKDPILVQSYISYEYKAPKEREFVIVKVKPLNRKARRISESKEL